jgi:hypothetical protein
VNEQWRNADADAHEAKAEAIETAMEALAGLTGALDSVEELAIVQTVNLLQRARARHDKAAKLGRAA